MGNTKSKIVSAKNTEAPNPSYVRRTITIAPKVNLAITEFRIEMMRAHPEREFDYTTLANALMAYGAIFLQDYQRTQKDDDKAGEMVGGLFDLAEYGLGDMVDTLRRWKEEQEAATEEEKQSQGDAKRREGKPV